MGKDKVLSKLSKEFQELQKTNQRLQKEREKQLLEKKVARSRGGDDQNSNVCQNGQMTNGQRFSASQQKLYDPLQFSENGDEGASKRVVAENDMLKEEVDKLGRELMTLRNKRLQDLNLLQEEHEREIADIVKEQYGAKIGDTRIMKLQVRKLACSREKGVRK